MSFGRIDASAAASSSAAADNEEKDSSEAIHHDNNRHMARAADHIDHIDHSGSSDADADNDANPNPNPKKTSLRGTRVAEMIDATLPKKLALAPRAINITGLQMPFEDGQMNKWISTLINAEKYV
jgi:hypothetical protein